MNLIDLVAILPFYIELMTGGGGLGAIFRVLRVSRVFRIFKLGKYNRGMMLVGRVLGKSAHALYLLLFFDLIGMILFGSMIFFAEAGELDQETGYIYIYIYSKYIMI